MFELYNDDITLPTRAIDFDSVPMPIYEDPFEIFFIAMDEWVTCYCYFILPKKRFTESDKTWSEEESFFGSHLILIHI